MASVQTFKSPETVANWVRRILRIWPDEELAIYRVPGGYALAVSGDHQKELDAMVASEYYRGD